MGERAWSDASGRWAPIRLSRVRALQVLITLLLTPLTVLVLVDAERQADLLSPALHMTLLTVVTLVAGAIAMLGFAASHEPRDGAAMLDGAAFLILAVANGAHVLLDVTGFGHVIGLDRTEPRATPLFVAAIVRDVAAALLLLAAFPGAIARVAASTRSRLIVIAPAAVTTAIAIVLLANIRFVEPLVSLDPLATLPGPGEPPVVTSPPLVAANALGVVLLAAAAYLRPRRQSGALPRVWLAAALSIGVFYTLHVMLHPAEWDDRITSASLLQVAFYVTLLGALQASRAADFQLARAAYDRGRRLRRADQLEAAQSERLRLARELHDGVVQALVAVRNDHAHAASLIDQGDPLAQAAARRVADGLTDALGEARRAIDLLRNGSTSDHRLLDELGPGLRRFADRHGYALDFRGGETLVGVAGVRATEVLRIVDEALANIRRHADATSLRVTAARAGEQLIITIADNGRGFDPRRTPRGHGITGMHERAELLGGRLTIHSARGEGAQLRLMVPLRSDDDGD